MKTAARLVLLVISIFAASAIAAELATDGDYRMTVTGMAHGRAVNIYMRIDGGKVTASFAEIATWNQTVHNAAVDEVRIKDGRLRCHVTLSESPDEEAGGDWSAELVLDVPLGQGGYGDFSGKDFSGRQDVSGTVAVRRLERVTQYDGEGELDLALHGANEGDKNWKRLVHFVFRGLGDKTTARGTSELYRRGTLIDADRARLEVSDDGKISGGFSYVIPASKDTPQRRYEHKLRGQIIGGRVAGLHEWTLDGGEPQTFVCHGWLHRKQRPIRQQTYKSAGGVDLAAIINLPADWKASDRRPVMVYFSGGGFHTGSLNQIRRHAYYLASRGMVVVRADYRVFGENRTFANIMEDPRSAVRWVRGNASRLGIDPNRIMVGGGSAGGLFAVGTTVIDGFDDFTDDLDVPTHANAILTISGLVQMKEEWIQQEELKPLASRLDPLGNVGPNMPPMLMTIAAGEDLYRQNVEFAMKSRKLGNRVDFVIEDGGHHTSLLNSPGAEKLCHRLDRFLVSLGWLEDEPTIEFDGAPLREAEVLELPEEADEKF